MIVFEKYCNVKSDDDDKTLKRQKTKLHVNHKNGLSLVMKKIPIFF